MNALLRPLLLRAVVFGLVTGGLAGGGAFVFLEVLDAVTDARGDQPWLLWLLPVFGVLWGWLQWTAEARERWRRSMRGTTLVVHEARCPSGDIPRRQAPLVLGGTWLAHLTGASVGREGVGLQVSASLAEHVARRWRLERQDRRLLLAGAIAGGFGAVFGVPWAGMVFALEIAGRPRWTLSRILTSLAASFTGHTVVHTLGHRHGSWPEVGPSLGLSTWAAVVIGAVVFAVTARSFVATVERLRAGADRLGVHRAARPALAGLATVLLALLVGRDHLGLSLPLLDAALAGDERSVAVPALKALFTVIALAGGFPGGEVTPLFVMGASLGAALSVPLGVDATTLAALGMVAVFAAASGAPLASAVMAAELFGPGLAGPALAACLLAALLNRRRRLYVSEPDDQAVASTRTGSWRGPRI